MATISARIDDEIKTQAERIADDIGISLSSAINIFLKRFIAEQGFPFSVTSKAQRQPHIIDREQLTHAVQQAVASGNNPSGSAPKSFMYIDATHRASLQSKEE